MKKMFLLAAVLLLFKSSWAQKSEVLAALKNHKIDENIINLDIKEGLEDYYFDSKRLTLLRDKEKIETANHDPSKPSGQRWTLISVDGKSPSRSDLNNFNKEHNQSVPRLKIDESTLKLESQDNDHLVISYKYDPASIPNESSFMKDCRNYVHINTATGFLEKSALESEKPVKIKVLNVSKINSEVNYSYNTENKTYLIKNEKIIMAVKFIGMPLNMAISTEYSNYKK